MTIYIKKNLRGGMGLKKYKILRECIDALNSRYLNLLVVIGEPGVGKSFTIRDTLNRLNSDYSYNLTYSTPLAFYKLLYQNRNKDVIVFDDLYGLSDPLIKSMLKSACGENLEGRRIINYNSTSPILEKEGIPESFEINARIILIFNEDISGFEPIINRGVLLKFDFSFDEKKEIFLKFVEEDLIDKEVLEYSLLISNAATKNLSLRTLIMLTKLKQEGYDYISIADEILEKDPLIDDLISLDENSWCEKTGKHKRTYYRHKKKYNL
jgi:hypothetical protein